MRLTQGTFSFLPDLSDAQISAQIEYCLQKGWAVSVEYTEDPQGNHLAFHYPNGLVIYHNKPNTENLAIEGTGEQREAKPVPVYKGEGGIYGDFIHCVKTRERPFRDIELAVNTIVLSHLGTIAYDLRRSLKWDSAAQQFVGDDEANRFLDRARREPWVL